MLFAFPLLWAAGAVAAFFYAQDRGIPWATALAVLPAFLLEVSLYFTMGVERLRLRLEKLPPAAHRSGKANNIPGHRSIVGPR